MLLDAIAGMLRNCDKKNARFPSTLLYNENWLIRLILHWLSENRVEGELSYCEGATWYSEAWLPSQFLARSRRIRDKLAESWTHADGVIGHFEIGKLGKDDLALSEDAKQFVVLEGKVWSPLSPNVTNAPEYDQAARTVACMAETLKRVTPRRDPKEIEKLGYYVLAPEEQIEKGGFDEQLSLDSIKAKVVNRVRRYEGEKDEWLTNWFEPTIQHINIECLSWERIIGWITDEQPEYGHILNTFYDKCKTYCK